MEIVKKKIADINPAPYNPRKNLKPGDAEWEHIQNSINTFGYIDPIIVNGRNNVIVGGHQRYKILKSMGYEEIDCVMVDMDEQQEKACNAALNKAQGEWDFDALKDLLADITDFDMSNFGFDLDFDEEQTEIVEDDYEVELPKEPKAKLGDIYQLGNHRLMCGDSTSITDVEKLMDGQLADMLLTDPPYNVDYEGKTKDKLKIENDKMDNDNFRQFLVDAFSNADMCMKPGAVFYVWHA